MSKITLVGLDTAKSVFHLVAVDEHGQVGWRRCLRRAQLLSFFGQLPRTRVVLEACGGSHHWGRRLREQGHTVQLIGAQFVSPYRRGQKNDYRDAEAIAAAALSPGMRFVQVKSAEQQAVQALHRVRERALSERVAVANQLRGLLAEHGVVFGRGERALIVGTHELLERSPLPAPLPKLVAGLLEELARARERLREYEQEILALARRSATAQALQRQLPGVGPLTATALPVQVADVRVFANGRQFAAYLGLVARQHSSGGRTRLGRLSKCGDRYLRKLLIHGARAVLRHLGEKPDADSVWLRALLARRGFNKACVALAHRNARRAWAIMARQAALEALPA
ncbi:MAG: IS110 family transposase [Gammaproteobacteria bacterium]|nr:MAG: IS110 family transposase [Gammaproteobacteria bacterium]